MGNMEIELHRSGSGTKKPALRPISLKILKKQEIIGRGKRIRTSGPCLPKTVLYQAELFPDRSR